MIILGIDPGLNKTGWGIIEKNGNTLRYKDSGLIKPDAKAPLPERLAFLHHELIRTIKQYAPQSAAVEETFINKNAASALKLGQARGVVLAAPAIMNIPAFEYSANKVKKSVTCNGHASKEQIAMMVKTLLPASGKVSEDEADALAVAITHAHHTSSSSR